MLVRHFTSKHNDNHGKMAWMLKGAPASFEPWYGLAVAHDTLEHFPGDDGSIDAEARAIGAALLVRVEGGYAPDLSGFGGDIGELYTKLVCRELMLAEAPPTVPLGAKQEADIASFTRSAQLEIEHTLGDANVDEFRLEAMYDAVPEYLEACAAWLRVGYRAAKRRYCRRHKPSLPIPSPWDLSAMFKQIADEADKALKEVEEEGRDLTVLVNITRLRVDVRLAEPAWVD